MFARRSRARCFGKKVRKPVASSRLSDSSVMLRDSKADNDHCVH